MLYEKSLYFRLEFIHNHGLVHEDIKPENMLIQPERVSLSGDETEGPNPSIAVKLIDFGLTSREREFTSKKIVGTAYYKAPEAILGAMSDRRTDLYSLGVAFYRTATGQLPFTGKNNLQILKAHLEKTPPEPHEVSPAIPKPVSSLIMKLMARKPDQRPQSAAEVIELLSELRGRPSPVESARTAKAYIDSLPITGRTEQLQSLQLLITRALNLEPDCEAATGAARSGGNCGEDAPPSILLIEGEEGTGKTRLVRELKLFAQTRGALVLNLDSQEPVEDLSGKLNTAPANQSILKAVSELGSKQPIFLRCEDFQSCSEEAAGLLHELIQLKASSKHKLPFLAAITVRPESRSIICSQFLMLEEVRDRLSTTKLARLETEEVKTLLEDGFPENRFPGSFAEQLTSATEGIPKAIVEALSFLVKEGKIACHRSIWSTSFNSLDEVVLPLRSLQNVKEKKASLDPKSAQLAGNLSILTEPFHSELVLRLSDIQPRNLLTVLTKLRSQGILTAAGDKFTFASTTIRQAFAKRLPEEKRKTLHSIAAEFLLEKKEAPPLLFHHFYRAGDHKSALKYGFQGAKELRKEWKLRKALEIFQKLVTLPGWSEECPEAGYHLAEILVRLGMNRQAARILSESLDLELLDAEDSFQATSLLSEVLIKLGKARKAGRLLDRGLRAAKKAGAYSAISHMLYVAACLFYVKGEHRQCLNTADRALSTLNGKKPNELWWRLNLLRLRSLARLGKTDHQLLSSDHLIRPSDKANGPGLLPAGLRCAAAFWRHRGSPQKAIAYLETCLSGCQRLNLKTEELECAMELAELHLSRGEALDARRILRPAFKEIQASNNKPVLVRARLVLAESAWLLGYHEEAAAQSNSALQVYSALKDASITVRAHLVLARIACVRGNGEGAHESLIRALKESRNAESVREVKFTRALAMSLHGKWDKVWKLLEKDYASGRSFHTEATVLTALAAVSLGRIQELENLKKGLKETASHDNSALLEAVVAFISGLLDFSRERTDSSITHFNEAVRLGRSCKSAGLVGWVCVYLSRACAKNNHYGQAQLVLEEGLFMAKRIDHALLKGLMLHGLGRLELEVPAGRISQALTYLSSAEKLAAKHSLSEVLGLTKLAAGRANAKQGHFKAARSYLEEGISQLTSLLEEFTPSTKDTAYLSAQIQEGKKELKRLSRLSSAHRSEPQGFFGLLGKTSAMQELFLSISKVKPNARWIRVTGPKGSGKTLTAEAIHRYLNGKEDKILYYDCETADPVSFRDMLSKASSERIETLVLEEISKLPEELSELIQNHRQAPPKRIIATTCHPLEGAAERGLLPGEAAPDTNQQVAVPPLKSRAQDIDILLAHYLKKTAPESRRGTVTISKEARELLHDYSWPGNTQELVQFCVKANSLAGSEKEISKSAALSLLGQTETEAV